MSGADGDIFDNVEKKSCSKGHKEEKEIQQEILLSEAA